MDSSIKYLNVLIPLLVTLVLNWLFLHPTDKPLRKLDKATRRILFKTYPRCWHRVWSAAAIAAGNLAIFLSGWLALTAITDRGLTSFKGSYPFIRIAILGIVILASGYASRAYWIIDALATLLSKGKPSEKQPQDL